MPAPAAPVVDPPPVAVPIARRAGARAARVAPSMRFDAPGGYLQFYPSDGRITATCTTVGHGDCVLTRFNRIKSRMGGRPCGMMLAWLASGPVCEHRSDHWSAIPELEADYGFRAAQRAWMMEQAGGPEMLSVERDAGAGLEKEPAKA